MKEMFKEKVVNKTRVNYFCQTCQKLAVNYKQTLYEQETTIMHNIIQLISELGKNNSDVGIQNNWTILPIAPWEK